MSPLESNVAEYLLADKAPDAIALRTLTREYTYGELALEAAALESRLRDAGAAKGDRVVLAAENSLFWVSAYLGAIRTGLVIVPVPVDIGTADFVSVLDATEPRVVVANSAFYARHRDILRSFLVLLDSASSTSSAPSREPPGARGDELAALMFTSGSTGKPRGVMISHRNIIANSESIIQCLGLTASDRIMTVLPFHYCFGASLLHTHLRVGGSLVLDSRFTYPERVLQHMIDSRCTGFAGVPSHYQILLRRSSVRRKQFPCLRRLQQAGGPLPAGAVRELRDAFPGAQVFLMYGQTEATARLSCLPPEMIDSKPGSVGRGIPGVTLKVLDQDGRCVRPGETGEVVAQGDSIALGYWRAPEESTRSFRNGLLYTGDLATIDTDGYIYIIGRARDFLKCGGKRIASRQIEEQILACDAVAEASVLPVPDEILGDAVLAVVVPRRPGDREIAANVRAFCRRTMPLPLVPKKIVVLDALPRNSTGKVLKEALKAMRLEEAVSLP